MDNTIALNVMAPKIDTPFESQGKALQLRQLMQAGQQADYQARQQAQAEQDDASYRQALQANPTGGAGLLSSLASAGNYKGHASAVKAEQERLKGEADIGKTKADTGKSLQETAGHQFEIAGQLVGSWANNPAVSKQQIIAGLNAAAHSGVISPEIAQGKIQEVSQVPEDPRALNGWAQNTLTQVLKAKDQFALTTADANARLQAATSVQTNAATNATSRANNAATQAGENSRATARLGAENNQVIESDAGPVLVNRRAGTTQTISGPNGQPLTKTKPLTEFQGKSAAFGDRALASDKILSEIGSDYSPTALAVKSSAGNLPLIGGIAGTVGNAVLSGNDQRVEQAQRDFINSVLRQESGAAISPSEFENARKQYFPQPNDKPETVKQKANNRKLVIEGFKRSAGSNANIGASAPAAAGGIVDFGSLK